MNTLLSVGDWFAQNWIILVLIVLAVALLVPTYLRQKKEVSARNELNSSIKKGTKIITTAGVYGVVESIENTTDGKVVTILTGSSKNPTTMTIHINAIGGIDNKKHVEEDAQVVTEKVEDKKEVKEPVTEEKTETVVEVPEEKKESTPKKSSAKTSKKTTKKATETK